MTTPTLPNKQISHPPIEFRMSDPRSGLVTTQHMDWLNSIKPTLENTITNQYISMSYTKSISTENTAPNINNPKDGYMTYNTDNTVYQGHINGAWKIFNMSASQYANSTPNITTAQRNALTPGNGDLIINTTTGLPQIYLDGAWKTITVS